MKQIRSALISVFYKEGLEPVIKKLSEFGLLYTARAVHNSLLKNWDFPVFRLKQ